MKIKRFTALIMMLLFALVLSACGGGTKNLEVKFDSAGGEAVSSQSVKPGSLLTDPGEPKNNGSFAFEGWYNGDTKWDFEKDKVTESITLTAKWNPLYTVQFDSDGGSAVAAITAEFNECVTEPNAPKKAGFAFKGWYNGDELWNFDTDKVTGNLYLKAKWNTTHSVSFDTDGALTDISPIDVETGLFATKPENPAKNGFAFKGWYFGENEWDFNSNMVTDDITLKAKWVKVHTVAFDFDTDGEYILQEVEDGFFAIKPEDPKKEGFVFGGWYFGGNEWVFDSNFVTSDMVLTAKWETPVTVTFDSNGGNAIESISAFAGQKITAPAPPTRQNYGFIGWFCNGVAWDFENGILTESITLTAQWRNETTYSVKFDTAGGNSVDEQHITHGSTANKPSDPSREGYIFSGWYVGEAEWNISAPITGDITITAKWEITKYTVKFDPNNGEEAIVMSIPYKGTVTLPAIPKKDHYTFSGWYNGESAIDTEAEVTADITFTAKWNINSYEVSFNTNGAAAIPDQIVVYGEKAKAPADPVRSGYVFKGWFVGNEPWSFDNTVSGKTVITAKWNELFKVTFDSNGGTAVDSIFAENGTPISAPTPPTRKNHKFLGWADKNGADWNFANKITENTTLTAKWKNETTYTVKFENTGDYAINDQYIVHGNTVNLAGDPTREGYKFLGWFIGETEWSIGTSVTSDLTLTAKWELLPFTVKFNTQSDTVIPEQLLFAGEKITRPATDPTRTGHTFDGWYYGDTPWNFENIISCNMTITAKWTPIVYKVSFNTTVDYVTIPDQLVEYGGYITKPKDPEIVNFKFEGWKFNGSFWDFEKHTVAGDMTLNAYLTYDEPMVEMPGHRFWYWIEFDTNGGEPIEKQKHASNVTIASQGKTLPIPVKEGYTFGGWFYNGELFDQKNTKITKDYVLVARWGHTVTFEIPGQVSTSKLVEENMILTKPNDPASDGAEFLGWYCNDKKWNFETDKVTGDIVLTAKWAGDMIICFDSNGGTSIPLQILNFGEKITAPQNITLDGYTLEGWYNGTEKWNFESDIPTSNMKLTAKWKKAASSDDDSEGSVLPEQRNSYTFTYVSDGVVLASKHYLANKTLAETGETLYDPPKKDGYKFAGWYVDGVKIDESILVNKDLIVSAKWENIY